MLYAAKFNPDGTGNWIPLQADTPVNPDLPSNIEGNLIGLPLRNGAQAASVLSSVGGDFEAKTEAQIKQFKQQYKNLGSLYSGNAEENKARF